MRDDIKKMNEQKERTLPALGVPWAEFDGLLSADSPNFQFRKTSWTGADQPQKEGYLVFFLRKHNTFFRNREDGSHQKAIGVRGPW